MSKVLDHTPTEAGELLARAERLSGSAHNAMRWPYNSFPIGIGVATSVGTFAMGLNTGRAFGIAYVIRSRSLEGPPCGAERDRGKQRRLAEEDQVPISRSG